MNFKQSAFIIIFGIDALEIFRPFLPCSSFILLWFSVEIFLVHSLMHSVSSDICWAIFDFVIAFYLRFLRSCFFYIFLVCFLFSGGSLDRHSNFMNSVCFFSLHKRLQNKWMHLVSYSNQTKRMLLHSEMLKKVEKSKGVNLNWKPIMFTMSEKRKKTEITKSENVRFSCFKTTSKSSANAVMCFYQSLNICIQRINHS